MSLHVPAFRAGTKLPSTTTFICNQCRHATLLRRPKRPYTFTQLIALSDGSTFTHRTTSPQAIYRSTRDTRSAPLWNPSSHRLVNAEADEAGRLAAFRSKYGRGWDAMNAATPETEGESASTEDARAAELEEEQEEDNLLDLISTFGQDTDTASMKSGQVKKKK